MEDYHFSAVCIYLFNVFAAIFNKNKNNDNMSLISMTQVY